MPFSVPKRQLVRTTALQCLTSQRRHNFFGRFFGKDEPPESRKAVASNPILDQLLKRKPKEIEPMKPKQGELTSSSIFGPSSTASGADGEQKEIEGTVGGPFSGRDIALISSELDPCPRKRIKWQTRKVIRSVQKRGRVSRKTLLKQTERESLSKSSFIKTSVKKMNPLARQIAGKSIDEAIVQMRFSKKRAARYIKEHLEYARNEATVKRGMGLGKVEGRTGDQIEIETKNKKRKVITDRTAIYVDQAWVGRGPYGTDTLSRARSRIDRLRPPYTSITVLLKEEATRVRLHEERERKRMNRKLWLPLPDRPITAQRQYYSW